MLRDVEEGSGRQGRRVVGFLGRGVYVTVGEKKEAKRKRRWWDVARLWRALTLIPRSLDYILQLMGAHGMVSEQGANLIF